MELTQHQFSTTSNWCKTGEKMCAVCWVGLWDCHLKVGGSNPSRLSLFSLFVVYYKLAFFFINTSYIKLFLSL